MLTLIMPAVGPGRSFCSRDEYLREKEKERTMKRDMKKCKKMRHNPGYEKLMKMRYGG